MASNALECLGPVPRGRPSDYNEYVAGQICERLAEGESLTSICADEDMPHRRTVNRWLLEHEAFSRNYAHARQMQADAFADEIHDIADDLRLLPDHKRVMIDARKWRAARQNWRAWGDKVTHEHRSKQPSAGQAQLPEGFRFIAGKLPGDKSPD